MPSEKHFTSGNKNDNHDASGTPPDEERELARRTAAFGIVVLVLGAVAAWFVATALSNSGLEERLFLSAPVEHTVVLLRLPMEQKETAEAMVDHPVLQDLTGNHRVYLRQMGSGRIGLCAGRFESRESSEAQRLLRRVSNYTRDGKKAFPHAAIIAASKESN